ncbi:MAG: hypothetical protein LBM95_03570 [Lactobacillales bacterium]|nr:hypothetical protein [Lactobacillales bacterium]
MRKKVVGIAILFFAVGVLGIFYVNKSFVHVSDAKSIEKIYLENQEQEKIKHYDTTMKSLEKKEKIYPISNKELFQLLENSGESYILYAGRNNCGMCQSFIKGFESILSDTDKKVYYFDTNKKADDYYEKVKDKLMLEKVPEVMKIAKGEVIRFDAEKEGLYKFIEN